MRELIEITAGNVKELFFPKKCLCGKWGRFLCGSCEKELYINKNDVCLACKKISAQGRTCSGCKHKTELTGLMVVADHEGVWKDLIWRYKYRRVMDSSELFVEKIVDKYGDFLKNKNFLLMPSPLTKKKLNTRGFNQSEIISKRLAKALGLTVGSGLSRKFDLGSQVGKSRRERLAAVSGQFEFIGDGRGRVLIIDDVYTTGATMNEIAKTLRKAGFREVWGLVLSRD